jgi:hypothetical protein
MPTSFSSDNPPPLIRILDLFKFISDTCSYESILLIHQDLYPARPFDAEVSDSNHDGQDDPKGNDDGGQGAPSSKLIVPNLTGSGWQCKSTHLQPISLQLLLLGAAILRRKNALCFLPSANSMRPLIK